jgi:hypothetical protein
VIKIYIHFYGNLGSGKSFSISLLALDWLEKCKEKNIKYEIYSNLDFKYQNGKVENLFQKYRMGQLQDGISRLLLLDEIQFYSDARRSMSNQNLHTTDIMALSRKLEIDIFSTSQMLSQVDKRFKELSYALILPNLKKNGNKGILEWDIIKVQENLSMKKTYIINDLKKIYELYNTKNVMVRASKNHPVKTL